MYYKVNHQIDYILVKGGRIISARLKEYLYNLLRFA